MFKDYRSHVFIWQILAIILVLDKVSGDSSISFSMPDNGTARTNEDPSFDRGNSSNNFSSSDIINIQANRESSFDNPDYSIECSTSDIASILANVDSFFDRGNLTIDNSTSINDTIHSKTTTLEIPFIKPFTNETIVCFDPMTNIKHYINTYYTLPSELPTINYTIADRILGHYRIAIVDIRNETANLSYYDSWDYVSQRCAELSVVQKVRAVGVQ